jgi:prepilin-type N-terminal cleavage/methylation domain-containing protein
MTARAGRGLNGRNARRGFSLTELLIAITMVAMVLASVVRLMVTQARGAAKERGLGEVLSSEQSGIAVLAWDIRTALAGGGQFIIITADSMVLHTVLAQGVVCAKNVSLGRYGIWGASGTFQATSDDSVLVDQTLLHGQAGAWREVRDSAVGADAAMGITACSWTDHSRVPSVVIQLKPVTTQDTSGIYIGAAVRGVRRVQYGLYPYTNGHYYLARRLGSGTSYDLLAGPFLSPAGAGLKFAYFDSSGVVATTVPANVRFVQVTLRGQSTREFIPLTGAGILQYQTDSTGVSIKIAVRP